MYCALDQPIWVSPLTSGEKLNPCFFPEELVSPSGALVLFGMKLKFQQLLMSEKLRGYDPCCYLEDSKLTNNY